MITFKQKLAEDNFSDQITLAAAKMLKSKDRAAFKKHKVPFTNDEEKVVEWLITNIDNSQELKKIMKDFK